MRLVDTHAHLDFPEFDSDREEVIRRSKLAGVVCVVNVGADLASSRRAVELAGRTEGVRAGVGIHPHEADHVTEEAWGEIEDLCGRPGVVAIGETGLDYYRDLSDRGRQRELFERHLELARRKGLPVAVHSREAHGDMQTILEKAAGEGELRGVMHCFSGSEEMAQACMRLGLFISFAGTVTYPNARKLQDVCRGVPIERMLVETDSPYLAPQARRGKRNEPGFVRFTAEGIAQLKGLSVEDVARVTTLNAEKLFGLGLGTPSGEIAYPIRDSLYLNITNRCSNECSFCIRTRTEFVKGHHLRLEREPEYEEVVAALEREGLERYAEVVFCGYGEPTERLELVKRVAGELKRRGKRVRMVTNGQGDLINGRSVAGELAGLVDAVSVSLNTAHAGQYQELCASRFGSEAFGAIVRFIREAALKLGRVEVTAVEAPGVDVEAVRKLAGELGVEFRLRHYHEVG